MIQNWVFKFVVLGFSAVAISACATNPIAKEYRQEAKMEDLTFSMISQNPDAYVGEIVLWGGVIVETTNEKGGTDLIVLDTPLGREDRPRGTKYSRGRFIATTAKFLDPAIYHRGRKITLAGQITGKKTLPLGKTAYTYPVVTVKQLHLWQRHRRHYVYPYYWEVSPYWYWYPGYYGYYDFDEGFDDDEEGWDED